MKSVEIAERIQSSKPGFEQWVLPGWEQEVAKDLESRKREILERYFTNVDGPITATKGTMPSVLAAALVARLSRAKETDVTELFWDEFVLNTDLGIISLTEELKSSMGLEDALAEEHARAVINRIISGFGDDSVREDASGYVFVQNSTVLHSLEAFLHALVTGIEASTRYIDWRQKDKNENYRYAIPVKILESEFGQEFKETMDFLFETYDKLWNPVWEHVVSKNPKPDKMSDKGYENAVRGKVCDILRKLLPLGVKTTYGLHADYRALSEVVMNLRASDLEESRVVADGIATELSKVNPEFIAVANSNHGDAWTKHRRETLEMLERVSVEAQPIREEVKESSITVEVINSDPQFQLAQSVIAYGNSGLSQEEVDILASKIIKDGTLTQLLFDMGAERTNRRHKIHDILANVVLKVKFLRLSFSALKDLNRHRNILTKSLPDWSAEMGFYAPPDIEEIGGSVKQFYEEAQKRAVTVYQELRKDFPVDARRVLTHGTRTAFEITMGLPESFWIEELRSIATGDPEYRGLAQLLHIARVKELPWTAIISHFVDMNDYELGRLGEARKADLALK